MKDPSVLGDGRSEQTVSSTLLERARHGDGLAFRRIVSLYAGLVYHWCRKSGLTPEDAEDVGQQVFLSVSRNLHRFQRKKPGDSFRAWIRVITRSRVADHFRGKLGKPNETASANPNAIAPIVDHDALGSDREDTIVLYERAVQLMQSEFSDQDCRAFFGVVVEGVPAKEVAQELAMSVNSVYIAKSRILKRLRMEFEGLLDDS